MACELGRNVNYAESADCSAVRKKSPNMKTVVRVKARRRITPHNPYARAQMPAAAAIGVFLCEEDFGHMLFSPNSPVGDPSRTQMGVSRFFLGGFWWREEHKDVHMLQATVART